MGGSKESGSGSASGSGQASPVVLQARHLTFGYPPPPGPVQPVLLPDWSATFTPGVALVRGGDGAGKSTLLRLLAGALVAQSGRLTLGGVALEAQPQAYRAQVFWCDPADTALDGLSGRDYLALRRGQQAGWDEAVLEADLAALAVQDHLDKSLHALSTGTRRKLRLAAGLASGARLTLFDDPFAALDRRSVEHVQRRLAACARVAADSGRLWVVGHHSGLDGVPLTAEVVLPERC